MRESVVVFLIGFLLLAAAVGLSVLFSLTTADMNKRDLECSAKGGVFIHGYCVRPA